MISRRQAYEFDCQPVTKFRMPGHSTPLFLNPLTDDELKDKVRSCCAGVLAPEDTERLIEAALGVTEMENAAALAGYLRVSL